MSKNINAKTMLIDFYKTIEIDKKAAVVEPTMRKAASIC